MAEEKEQEKKIIVDEGWKAQAQREKEQLKAKAEVEKEKKQEDAQEASQELPEGDISTLISMLATQAMFGMGFIRTEKDKEPTVDLKLAKFNIDMLETLEEKTKGNLSDDESKMLTDAISQLRMGYVKAAG